MPVGLLREGKRGVTGSVEGGALDGWAEDILVENTGERSNKMMTARTIDLCHVGARTLRANRVGVS